MKKTKFSEEKIAYLLRQVEVCPVRWVLIRDPCGQFQPQALLVH
jgi:hypothetical protein